MHVLRTRLLNELKKADRFGRFRVYYPHIPGLAEGCCLDVHSKMMVVDDRQLRIGSANLCNRSMGMDTECDVLIEARGEAHVAEVIRDFRDRLIAEHLGVAPRAVPGGGGEERLAAPGDRRAARRAAHAARARRREGMARGAGQHRRGGRSRRADRARLPVDRPRDGLERGEGQARLGHASRCLRSSSPPWRRSGASRRSPRSRAPSRWSPGRRTSARDGGRRW